MEYKNSCVIIEKTKFDYFQFWMFYIVSFYFYNMFKKASGKKFISQSHVCFWRFWCEIDKQNDLDLEMTIYN